MLFFSSTQLLAITVFFGLASASPLARHNGALAGAKRSPQMCLPGGTRAVLVGDGSPVSTILYKQLSVSRTAIIARRSALTPRQDLVNCGNGTCSVGYEQSVSYTISASLGGSVAWLEGGFGVSETIETGSDWTCDGVEYQNVCIFKTIPHIAVRTFVIIRLGADETRSIR